MDRWKTIRLVLCATSMVGLLMLGAFARFVWGVSEEPFVFRSMSNGWTAAHHEIDPFVVLEAYHDEYLWSVQRVEPQRCVNSKIPEEWIRNNALVDSSEKSSAP